MAISSAEYLARPAVLADTGLCSWPVARLEQYWTSRGRLSGAVGFMLTYPATIGLLVARLIAASLIVAGVPHSTFETALLLAVIVAVSVALVTRCQYGHDGADQMMFICTVVFLIANATQVVEPVLWFVAGQSALAYATAGIAKLVSPVWRSGKALPGVLRTRLYGNAAVYGHIVGRPRLAQLLSWSVIIFECSFPAALAGIPLVSFLLLAGGIAFHLVNAFVMRLNTFFLSFVATYPAVLFCAQEVRSATAR
jgi:hypothetical protein